MTIEDTKPITQVIMKASEPRIKAAIKAHRKQNPLDDRADAMLRPGIIKRLLWGVDMEDDDWTEPKTGRSL